MKVVVIGGGAAGMMAAYSAKINYNKITSSENDEVILIEKNEKLGKKIFITGKGRGNLTNNCDKDTFFSNIVRNSKFFNSAFAKFSNIDTMNFFIENGLKLKTERGNRVFPEEDHAYLITDIFKKIFKKIGVKVLLNSKVCDIIAENGKITSIIYKNLFTNENIKMDVDKLIVATGGLSYCSTGSTGDGYKFALKFDISVNNMSPALVPLKCAEIDDLEYVKGLKLKNVRARFLNNNKIIYNDFGEIYFEEKYLDGPIIRKASSILNNELVYILSIDFKPALDENTLDKRLIREIENNRKNKIIDILNTLVPKEMGILILNRLNIDKDSGVYIINKEIRQKLRNLLKDFKFTIDGNMGFDYAIITRGGINIKDINPSTMESKKIKGLFFAGEVIDIDAFTGGFNMQIAFSTGYLAGINNDV